VRCAADQPDRRSNVSHQLPYDRTQACAFEAGYPASLEGPDKTEPCRPGAANSCGGRTGRRTPIILICAVLGFCQTDRMGIRRPSATRQPLASADPT
jgi:hypothetical protein